MTSTALLIFIGWHRPMESNFDNNMELLNELATLAALYMMMMFTDFVGDPATRNTCGWAFIGVIILFLAIHLLFLLGSTCKAIYQGIRLCYNKLKKEEPKASSQASNPASPDCSP